MVGIFHRILWLLCTSFCNFAFDFKLKRSYHDMKKHIFLLAIALCVLASCTDGKFKVDGTIAGAGDSLTLLLEQSSNGEWFFVDSVRLDDKGSFNLSSKAPEFPGIYRVRLGGQSICFPIDSLDHITITTKVNAFGTDYEVAGSDHAVQIMNIDKQALKMASSGTPEQLEQWKHSLAQQIVADPGGIVAYYAINKWVNGRPLFDPLNDSDLRIVGAVANAFNSFRPNDPRTNYLVNVLLDGQRRRRAAQSTDTVYMSETALLPIKLQDYNGTEHDLQKVASTNRVVLLNFTVYAADFSPVFNKLLNDIYGKYHSRGLEIFQVSVDPDNVAWRTAAQPLPWITVYDPMGEQSSNVGNYNVYRVPTTFVIVGGEVVKRIEDANTLTDIVARYL